MNAAETTILDIAENGVFIVDKDLTIIFWNNWLAVNTQIKKSEAQGKLLTELYPETSFTILKRKIKIALKLGSSTYANSTVDKFIIPIKLETVTSARFRHMRQDAVITPLDENRLSVILYDTTPLLDAKAVIKEQLELVRQQATTDALTGCYNRKMFYEFLTTETARAKRNSTPLSLIIFDIDNFKSINDTFGHLTGDEVLKAVATIGSSTIRKSDLFARWGGEEFIILLPDTNLQGAIVVAEKVRHAIAEFDYGKGGRQSCSFGVALFENVQPDDLNLIIHRADTALYFSKEHGKNMVAFFTEGGPSALK